MGRIIPYIMGKTCLKPPTRHDWISWYIPTSPRVMAKKWSLWRHSSHLQHQKDHLPPWMCIPITRKRFFIHNLISHMHFSHVLVSMGDIPHTQTYIYIYIYYILSYYIFLYYVILYYIISYYVILCHIILYFNILYYIKWYYIAYTLHNIYICIIFICYTTGGIHLPPQ